MSGTLTVSGLVAGLLSGEKVIGPETMTGSATVGEIADVSFAAGDTTVSVPAGASVVLLVLPESNTQQLAVRTNLDAGTGMSIGDQGYVVFPIATGVTALVVSAGAAGVLEASFL